MTELVANFTLTDNPIEANFSLEETNIDALFEIKAAGTTWGNIVGNITDQTDLQAALNAKQNIIADLEAIRTGAQNGDFSYSTILTYGDIVTYNAAAFATAAQGALAETALQSVTSTDITTALGYIPYNSSNPNGYITANALTGYALLSDIPTDNSQLSNGAGYITSSDLATVATTGDYNDLINKPVIPPGVVVDQVYNSTSANAQSGIAIAGAGFLTSSSLNGYATENWVDNQGFVTSEDLPIVNNNTIFIQKNGINIDDFTLNQNSNKTINITVPTTAADVGALADTTTINDLTTLAQQNALNSGATTANIGQIATNTGAIAQINTLIPSQATASNQLADKSFVNSSIATNTAYFIGTFNSVAELEAYSGTLTNNDYAFVQTTDSAGNTLFDRYKWNGTQWLFEYELNNSSFTAEQWAAVNSGITSSDVALIATSLQPNDNITQLTNNVGYITSSALSPYVLSSSLATVATSGDYNDLSNLPTIPAAQVQSNWTQSNTLAVDYIKNKPTIPTVNNATLTIQKNGTTVQTFTANASSNVTCNITVPTNTNELTNGAGFITDITGTDVTTALGYTPYNSSNPAGYTSNVGTVTSVNNVSPVSGNVTLSIPTDTSDLTNGAGFITGISSSNVITALGYTPYNSTNPNGYITGINSSDVTTALGYSPANVSLSNVDDTAKITMSEMGMPSGTNIDLSLGASGATYTAPANGYFYLRNDSTASGQFVSLTANSAIRLYSSSSNQLLQTFIPVKKGVQLTVTYSAPTKQTFKFYYAQGAESEAN